MIFPASREGNVKKRARLTLSAAVMATGQRWQLLRDPRWKERLSVATIALIATYFLFCEYLPPFKRFHLWSDVAGYHYPLHAFAFHALKEGRIPQWDASIYCGISFAGNIQAAFFYPPTWLMYALFWNMARIPFKAIEAFTFLHVWFAFLLCFLWLRGRSGKLPSILGASVFAGTGYMVYQVLHPGVVGAMTWMPLAFWGIDEAAERRDWRPLWKVTAALALSFLAGYPAAWIANCIVSVAYGLASRARWRGAAGVAAALLASVPLFLAQFLPAWEVRSFMALEPKYGPGAYGWQTLLLSSFVPNWFDFNPVHPTNFEPGCISLYLGLPALYAVGWALWRHQFRAYAQAIFALGVALLFANPPLFLQHLVGKVPALYYTMQPQNFYSAVPAMAALITAISLNDFLERRSKRLVPIWALTGAMAASAIWSARDLWIWSRGAVFGIKGWSVAEAATALLLFSFCLWIIRQTRGRYRVLATTILLLATGIACKVYGSGRWFNAVSGDVDDEYPAYGIGGIDDTAYQAMWQNRQYRVVSVDSEGPHPLQYRVAGLATPEGFDPFISVQYKNTIQRWVPFRTNRMFDTDVRSDDMLQALGVRYLVVRNATAVDRLLAASSKFRGIGRTDIWCHVYEYQRSKPPFRWEEAGGTATPTSWIPERRDFTVWSEHGGRFVLIEQYFPGWRAIVDGQPADIERWGQAFQAIRLAPGRHHVTFEFRPVSLRVGGIVSLVSWIGLLVFVARYARWNPAPKALGAAAGSASI